MKDVGFTLVEVLVVIAILVMAMALLFPTFTGSRERARATVCRGRIRQLLLELYTYESDHQTLPYGFAFSRAQPPGGFAGDASVDLMGWWWFNFTGTVRYGAWTEMDVLRCPSKKLDAPPLKYDILCGNYGVNRSLCKSAGALPPYNEAFVGEPLSTTQVRRPGSTLLLVDSGYALISWWHATEDPPVILREFSIEDSAYIPGLEINRNKPLRSGQETDAINGRHSNERVNVGFVDGHIAPTRASDLLVEKTGSETWNSKPLWTPR